ncbi:MAG TPA: phosphate uptake regulator PhoU [Nitrososphaeraceae archaeon]|nr:phosphate uptake regulator PhoU [Nitrososphaeraceae archaeon]
MTRLLDLGIEHIHNIVMDMAKLSERSVFASIESYERGTSTIKKQIFEWSENLRLMQDEVSDLSIELIARYQPVATDLRFIRSCMEIAYDFSRFGRYSYDIVDVLETMGSISDCDKSYVLQMSNTVREMIHLSIEALQSRDRNAAQKLYEMDDTVDALYRKYVNEIINPQEHRNNKKEYTDKTLRCYISTLLTLRYLERISDHACYIGDSVYYIVTGNSNPRR